AGAASIFDYDAHATAEGVIREIAHDPHTGIIHFHNSRNAFGGTYPQNGKTRRIWNRVSIESYDFKDVVRQGKAANFRGTAVQNVKENAIALLLPDRFAMAEHATVDRKGSIDDVVAKRSPVQFRNFLRAFFMCPESRVHLGQ